MKKTLLYCLLCLGSIMSPIVVEQTPVQAYTVTLNGRTAGNPSGQPLYDVNLDAGDIGRVLDPFVWRLRAGTHNTDGKSTPVDLAATAIFKVVNLSATQLVLDISITNRTVSTYQAAILSMGFGVSPNATSASLSQVAGQGDVTNDTDVFNAGSALNEGQQNLPGGFKGIDICAFAANGCDGGKIGNGLFGGRTDSFRLAIGGNFGTSNGPRVTMNDFGLKFQTQDGSYELAAVPEPITMVGSGLALGFGALMRRKVSQKQKKSKVVV